MRLGAVLSPVAGTASVIEAATAAEAAGLESVGLWDHYHSARPEWAYVCGWSAFGAIAVATKRVRLVPMVLNNLHYDVGVLAKESSVLAQLSGDRFELGIGAGDWPESFAAWGTSFPPAEQRIARLEETVEALRELWSGRAVTRDGRYVRLRDAACTPAPSAPPRVVLGVAKSRRALELAVRVADEANLYGDEAIVDEARWRVRDAPRPVELSLFFGWQWVEWPADPYGDLARWRDRGIDRCLISVGSDDMPGRITELAEIASRLGP